MPDVQVDVLAAEALHLVVYGPGDDVSGGQLATLVKALHKGCPVRQQ